MAARKELGDAGDAKSNDYADTISTYTTLRRGMPRCTQSGLVIIFPPLWKMTTAHRPPVCSFSTCATFRALHIPCDMRTGQFLSFSFAKLSGCHVLPANSWTMLTHGGQAHMTPLLDSAASSVPCPSSEEGPQRMWAIKSDEPYPSVPPKAPVSHKSGLSQHGQGCGAVAPENPAAALFSHHCTGRLLPNTLPNCSRILTQLARLLN